MKKLYIEKLDNTYGTTWLITMYDKKNWYSSATPIAQWREHSKKLIMKKATTLLEQFHKLEMEVM